MWFNVAKGEFVCLIGHSGCGKTTLLNILAGLDKASDGVIIVDDRELTGTSLDRAVVFQHHALLPWMTTIKTSTSQSIPLAQLVATEGARALPKIHRMVSEGDKKPRCRAA